MTHAAELDDPPLATLDKVGVRFRDRAALSDVTCDLPVGTVCAVVGPNGAGKTTLLRVLAGTLAPGSGTIRWPATGAAPRIALVGQAVALYPFLTVGENCLAAGRMEGLRGASLKLRAAAAMEHTLCQGMERVLTGRLSGGYRRRAAIAAALMSDAPLLILDEPTTGLDAEGTEAIVATVRGLRSSDRTIVVSTHDFAFADALADRALFLRDGRLAAAGMPRRLCREFFPAAAHVELVLARPSGSQEEAVLQGLGARRRSALVFSLPSEVDARGCPTIVPRLQDAGIAVREIRFREPGIGLLYERFCLDRAAA